MSTARTTAEPMSGGNGNGTFAGTTPERIDGSTKDFVIGLLRPSGLAAL